MGLDDALWGPMAALRRTAVCAADRPDDLTAWPATHQPDGLTAWPATDRSDYLTGMAHYRQI